MPKFGSHAPGDPNDLRLLMRDHGITQDRLADLVYVSERQVRNWLTEKSPTPRWAVELLRFKIIANQV